MRKKKLEWSRAHKNWAVEDWKKVMFSDESYFFVQGKHSRFARISRGEHLSSAHFNVVVKHPPKRRSVAV